MAAVRVPRWTGGWRPEFPTHVRAASASPHGVPAACQEGRMETPTMHWKRELARKAIHASTLLVPVVYLFLSRERALAVVVPLAAFCLAVDLARLAHVRIADAFERVFGPLLRPHERRSLTGATYVLAGSALCILLFHKPVALLALLYLMLGDPAAALFGGRFGRTWVRARKSLEGALGCFLVCLAVALVAPLSPMWPDVPGMSVWARVAGSLVAALVEFVPVGVDDNLGIPLLSGLAMQALA